MRYLSRSFLEMAMCLVVSVLFAGSAWAEDGTASDDDRAGRRGEMRQKMLEEFDADGDGELNEDERATAREAMRSRRGGKGKGNRAKGRKGKGNKAKGQRGPKRGGHGGPPDPGKLFDKFDANGDGQLSRAEFMKLAEEVRPPRGRGDRDGARRKGPPPKGKRRFDSERPLQNPSDRPGPSPRGEGRRRFHDEEDPRAHGPRGRGPRGSGARGHQGHGPPNPEKVFERFDENGDDQLSREEFMKLAGKMREMHERHGRGGERGMRGGHGPRRGPPGEEGPQGRRRPPRPPQLESPDDGPELSEGDNDSA
ncbi:MAG: hypothetical protein GXP24_01700 [Planctomycetes bacterium]|nr:hypothetical protein [Planctomycetota bacterium]